MDLSTSMETGHILILIVLLLLCGGSGSMIMSLFLEKEISIYNQPVASNNTQPTNTKLSEDLLFDFDNLEELEDIDE